MLCLIESGMQISVSRRGAERSRLPPDPETETAPQKLSNDSFVIATRFIKFHDNIVRDPILFI